MKKLLYLFTASLLVITSCSTNEDLTTIDPPTTIPPTTIPPTTIPSTTILPKTIKYTDPANSLDNSLSTAIYNGNKIVSIKDENGRDDYTYNGDLIVKITSYIFDNGKDVKNSEELFTYSNNKLASSSYVENFTSEFPTGQYKGRSVFTYNNDGTITLESYSTSSNGVETKSNYVKVFTIVNGNLVKEVETNTASSFNDVRTYVYEYDSKNNPKKNVLGLNLLMDEDIVISVNNCIKFTATTTVNGSITYGPDEYKSVFVYDANGYPIKETLYKKDGITVDEITEYTY